MQCLREYDTVTPQIRTPLTALFTLISTLLSLTTQVSTVDAARKGGIFYVEKCIPTYICKVLRGERLRSCLQEG